MRDCDLGCGQPGTSQLYRWDVGVQGFGVSGLGFGVLGLGVWGFGGFGEFGV